MAGNPERKAIMSDDDLTLAPGYLDGAAVIAVFTDGGKDSPVAIIPMDMVFDAISLMLEES